MKSQAAMWGYTRESAGKQQHTYGNITIYCNASEPQMDADAKRERAVRKVVWTIIEAIGGDGQHVKAELETNYRKGIVWWRDERVAEWDGNGMNLKGAACRYVEAFNFCTKQ